MRLRIEPPDARRESYSGDIPRTPGTGARFLDLVVERQALGNWCWAAVGAAFAGYYRGCAESQHDVASALLGYDCSGCGTDAGLSARCNVLAMLDRVLADLGCFSHWSPGKPTLERIEAEIDAGRPLAVSIDWLRGGSHYVAVAGCSVAAGEVYVADPLHGPSVQAFSAFPHGYRGGGYWRGTYWTAPPAARAGPRQEPPREVRT